MYIAPDGRGGSLPTEQRAAQHLEASCGNGNTPEGEHAINVMMMSYFEFEVYIYIIY